MFFRPTKHRYGHLERAMMRPANIQPIAGCESAHSMQRPVAFRPGAPASCSRYGRSPDMPPSAASSSRVALGAGPCMFFADSTTTTAAPPSPCSAAATEEGSAGGLSETIWPLASLFSISQSPYCPRHSGVEFFPVYGLQQRVTSDRIQ